MGRKHVKIICVLLQHNRPCKKELLEKEKWKGCYCAVLLLCMAWTMISTILNVNDGYCLRRLFTNSGGSQLRRRRGLPAVDPDCVSRLRQYSDHRKYPIDLDKVSQISSPLLNLKELPKLLQQIFYSEHL